MNKPAGKQNFAYHNLTHSYEKAKFSMNFQENPEFQTFLHADGHLAHIYIHESHGKTVAAHWCGKEGLL